MFIGTYLLKRNLKKKSSCWLSKVKIKMSIINLGYNKPFLLSNKYSNID